MTVRRCGIAGVGGGVVAVVDDVVDDVLYC